MPFQSGLAARRTAYLKDVPAILGSVAEFTTSNTRRQAEVADGDLLIDDAVRKRVSSLSHGTYKDTDALLRP